MKRYIRSESSTDMHDGFEIKYLNERFNDAGNTLVKYRGNAQHVVIPDGVEIIGHGAFYGNQDIVSVQIPDSVRLIQWNVFTDCTNLAQINIPNGVIGIGSESFYGCKSLTSITIPDGVHEIPLAAFERCTSLKSVKILGALDLIGANAFDSCRSLTSITIPGDLDRIGEEAFRNCKNLKTVKLLGSVGNIYHEAFKNCTSLASITLPRGLECLGDRAFAGCKSLTDVTIIDPAAVWVCDTPFKGCPCESEFPIRKWHEFDLDKEHKFDADKKHTNSRRDDDNNEELSFDDWYNSDVGADDYQEFADELEQLVCSAYDVDYFEQEPSTQGYQGSDDIRMALMDGNEYSFRFDWYAEQSMIFEDGPKSAAQTYFSKVQEGIDSGSALEE